MSIFTLINADPFTQYTGMVVRAGSTPGEGVLAIADDPAHVASIFGVRRTDVISGASGPISALVMGTHVRLSGAASVGDTIYLSASVAGVGTNAAPLLVVTFGVCYAANLAGGIWYADLVPAVVAASSSGGGAYNTTSALNGEGSTNLVVCTPVCASGPGSVVRAKADALATSKVCGLWLSSSTAPGDSGNLVTGGTLTATTAEWDVVTGGAGGLVPNTSYFLDPTTAGMLTATAPNVTGFVVPCGTALSTTELVVNVGQPVEL